MPKKKKELLTTYQENLACWIENNQPIPDLKELDKVEIAFIKAELKNGTITSDLLKLFQKESMLTYVELREKLKTRPETVKKRVDILKKHRLLRVIKRSYLVATPRFDQFIKNGGLL